MKARTLRRGLNLWPPLWAAGIRVSTLSPDYAYAQVELRAHWWNRNYVGTHYGGSLYSMTDPFYMLLLINRLGRDYIVWDKAAHIRFRKPGRGTLTAEFQLSDAELDTIRELTATNGKTDREYDVLVKDQDGEVVAEVRKTLYIRRKDHPTPAS